MIVKCWQGTNTVVVTCFAKRHRESDRGSGCGMLAV